MYPCSLRAKLLYFAFLSWLCALPAVGKEGFGTTKLTVQLSRVRPPDVYITGTRIAVRSSDRGTSQSADQQLITALESALLGNDPRLSRDVANPQTAIEVAVLENNVNERWENRTESRSVKVGTDSKGKDRYESRYFQVRYKVIIQVFSVSYRVEDLAKGMNLDADNVMHNTEGDYREGADAPTQAQLLQNAIAAVVETIAQRLTPTREEIGVLIPKGTLKDLGNLAKAGLWDRYLEVLESQPKRANSNDESYRQYALGVAYEALGYAANESDKALSYLEQAALHYNAALTANPGEKYFVGEYKSLGILSGLRSILLPGNSNGIGQAEPPRKRAMAPLERVNTALAQYQKMIDFETSEQDRLTNLEGAKTLEEETPEEVLDNAAIIGMIQAGLAEEIILTTVDSAPKTNFDVSSKGLIELAKAKVSTTIIQQLQTAAAKTDRK